jgi:hypothetical protein
METKFDTITETLPAGSPHHLLLLESTFRSRTLKWRLPRARLYFDRIELVGWRSFRFCRLILPFRDVDAIEWDPGNPHKSVIKPRGQEPLDLQLTNGPEWQHVIERGIDWRHSERIPFSTLPAGGDLTEVIVLTSRMG